MNKPDSISHSMWVHGKDTDYFLRYVLPRRRLDARIKEIIDKRKLFGKYNKQTTSVA